MVQPSQQRHKGERAKRPPTGSVREAPFRLVRDATVDGQPNDGLTLDGYGAVFNRTTLIDSWEGRFKEQIAPGSMKRSFRDTPPKIQFDHGRHPLIGSLPVASLVSVTEDSDPELAPDGGAHIVGRLLDNWLVQPVRDAIAAGAVDGMSFRFEVLQEAWATADGKPIRDEQDLMRELDRVFLEDLADDDLPMRTLRQLKVPEMGPVTWPAYEETSVGVRSKVIDLGKLHQPEQRKLLARAVFMADALEAEPEGQRAVDTPIDTTDPDKIAALAGSLDATLDQASELVGTLDLESIDPVAAQVCNLVQAAETVADELLEALGVYDPDDDQSSEDDDGRSGQPVTEQADQHPTGEQRTTGTAGEHSDNGQRATSSAGEHHSNPRALTEMQLRLMNQRDRLLHLRAIGDRP
jgi:Escherichia/Staphylococcus phage prohead protease